MKMMSAGTRETGTKLAEFCAHALLALEVLIHPRDLPLIDFSSPSNTFDVVNSRFPDVYSYGNKQNAPFSGSMPGKGLDDSNYGDDHLYESWLANNDEIDIRVTDTEKPSETFCDPSPKKIPGTEKPPETFRDPSPEKIPPVADSFGTIVPVETQQEIDTAGAAERIQGKGDEIMAEAHQPQEPIEKSGTRVDDGGESSGAQLMSGIVSDSVVSDRVEGELATGEDVSEAKADLFATKGLSATVGTSILERGKHFSADLASESSMESLPDIVDGDPDSD